MRNDFIKTLEDCAEKDEDIFLVTGDLGFSVVEGFAEKFPGRFINAGVAEQNMIGVAAGLSLSGKNVYVYSIIPFVSMRCFEQVRNDICMQNLNVKLVGVGAGLHYGPAGSTHHAIEDVGVMRSLPNMAVISPTTPEVTGRITRESVKYQGPVYLRLGSTEEVDGLDQSGVKIGKGTVLSEGKDIALFVHGSILAVVAQVVEKLKQQNISTTLVDMSSIKPLDRELVLKSVKDKRAVFSVEEYPQTGGLGSAIAEVLAEEGVGIKFKRIALPDAFVKDVGSRNFLRGERGLSLIDITNTILKEL